MPPSTAALPVRDASAAAPLRLDERRGGQGGLSPRQRQAVLYAGVGLALIGAVWLAVGAILAGQRQAQVQAVAAAQDLARSVALTVEELFDDTANVLAPANEELARRIAADRVDEAAVARLLEQASVHQPYFDRLRAYDEDGDLLAGPDTLWPPGNVADWEDFRRARAARGRALLAGRIALGQKAAAGRWSVVQRIEAPDGSFAGILLAPLRLERLEALLARAGLEHGVALELRDASLGLVARTVFDGTNPVEPGDRRLSVAALAALQADPDEGSFVGDTYADPLERTYAYRRSLHYGFIVLAGLPQDRVLADWRRQSLGILALLGVFVAALLALARYLDRSWLRQERVLERIRNSEHSLNEAMGIARLGSFVYDLRGDTWTSSANFDEMFGIDANYPRDLVHWLKLVESEARSEMRGLVNRLLEKDAGFDHECRIVRPSDGGLRWVHCACRMRVDKRGNLTAIVGTYQDITERKAAEETIHKLAYFDQLTGLANRTELTKRLVLAMAASARGGHSGALLLIDLDHFKTLNDIHGHEKGDRLLRIVAQRLNACLQSEDGNARPGARSTVARLGGDEFVVVLPSLRGSGEEADTQAKAVATKILFTLSQDYELEGVNFMGTASIGVTLFKGERASVDELLKQADLAMYRAKASGRDAVCFFDADLEATVLKRAALEGYLRRALDLDRLQFKLYYQAQVLGAGHVTGAEVLVRWEHPVLGLVSPCEFIPVAEESNLILPLGQWVLETACRQLREWSIVPELADLSLAVNVSAHQFYQTDFVEQVERVLARTKARPHLLKIELTETLLLRDVDEIIRKMRALKALGVCFALDDFGTGYSSLLYLKRLPLDQLKIDQSFVRDVLTDGNDAAIARTVAALGQTLGLKVIAEGVENEAQREFLERAGCHAYQGYLFSRPLPLAEFEAYARRAWERDNKEFLGQIAQEN